MPKAYLPAPPDSFRELVYKAGERWYFKELPENKQRHNKEYGLGFKPDLKPSVRPSLSIGEYKYSVARLIYWLETGEWPDEVTYVDCDYQNLNASNIIAVTDKSLNHRRRYHDSNVRKNTSGNTWNAYVKIKGKQINIGGYATKELAQIAVWRVKEAINPGVFPMPVEAMKAAMNAVIDQINSVSSQSE